MSRRRPRKARLTEARKRSREALPGGRTLDEFRRLVEEAVLARVGGRTDERWVWVRDMTDEWVVYEVSTPTGTDCFRASFTVSDSDEVTLSEPVGVEARTVYEVTESADTIPGRVMEAKGEDDTGGRVFRVQVITFGDSRNGRRYPSKVMTEAAPLYEGAKAYDHHRTNEELTTSTINGLVGAYMNVAATKTGLEADLHLLPSATHTAEALDASLGLQAKGLAPLVGISHDVMARYQPLVEGGKRLMEATEIVTVNSADIVADPAAGGRATRMVAGGTDPTQKIQEDPMNLKQLLEMLRGATPERRAELVQEHSALLDDAGITSDDITRMLTDPASAGDGSGEGAGGSAGEGQEKTPELVGAGAATEAVYARTSPLGRMLLREAVVGAGLDERLVESVAKQLPDRFTETDLTRTVETARNFTAEFERAGLAPQVQGGQVTKDAQDKKVERLDAFFAGDHAKGYRSFKEAFLDITGFDPRRIFALDGEDFNRIVLRESIGPVPYDSSRGTESVTTTTWSEILGDAVTRRMIAEYSLAQLSSWRRLVSSTPPINDFRTQRIDRMGGYGTLPTVAEGAPYQPLTTPPDEEATYKLDKRGGTEDMTIETIANDDVRAIQRIPAKLGRAAAWTLYRFVWDFLRTNPTLTYDSVALFAAGHGNTDNPAALSQSTLSVGRRKMRQQSAYGDTTEILSIVPKFLVVPAALEELAFQLTTSAVAIPATPAGPSNTPNLHQGMEPIVLDYLTDTDDWFLAADPALAPTIEVGFYQGRQDPELFVQNDPTVGSVFTADKVTWKIRHIYSGTVLEHRSFYRGQGS